MTVIDINTKEDRETEFVKEYVLNGGNATQAAIACGLSKATAKQSGYRMKNKLGKEIEELQREVLKGYAPKAIRQIQGLAESAESENVRLKANTDLLDRAGYRPIDKSEITQMNEFENMTTEEIQSQRSLKDRIVGSEDDLQTASERLGHASTSSTQQYYRNKPTVVSPLPHTNQS